MYLSWKEKIINNFSETNVESMYNDGFVFTRIGKGVMNQTRSLRIDLNQFELSSENRRILGKTEDLNLTAHPIPYADYNWTIHKMGKNFYEKKFGEKTFSAQKIKELITNKERSNFNTLFVYEAADQTVGYCICLQTENILHYCYPFYLIGFDIVVNIGMGMMLDAIIWAKENNKKYIYLGSFQRPTDIYKLQFAGLEWFDGTEWKNDLEELKNELKTVM